MAPVRRRKATPPSRRPSSPRRRTCRPGAGARCRRVARHCCAIASASFPASRWMAIACSAASGRRWHAVRGLAPSGSPPDRRACDRRALARRSRRTCRGSRAAAPSVTPLNGSHVLVQAVAVRVAAGPADGASKAAVRALVRMTPTFLLFLLLPLDLPFCSQFVWGVQLSISSPIGCRTIAKVAGRTKRRRSSSNTVCTWQSRRSGTRLEKAKAGFSSTGTYSFRSRERADVPGRPSCRPSGTVCDAHRWHLHPVAGPGVAARVRWPKAEGNGVSHYRPTSNRACRIRDNNGCGCRPPTVATRPIRRARCRPSRRRNGHAVPAAPAARPSRSQPP